MIAFSFNVSRLVTEWSGFSFKWNGQLLSNRAMLDAALLQERRRQRAIHLAAAESAGT